MHNLMSSLYPISRLSTLIGVSIVSSLLFASNLTKASQGELSKDDENKMLSNYDAAMASGNQTAAVKYVLDYSEKARGENAAATVNLTYRYGSLLYQDGKFREATEVLKKALERSIAAMSTGP